MNIVFILIDFWDSVRNFEQIFELSALYKCSKTVVFWSREGLKNDPIYYMENLQNRDILTFMLIKTMRKNAKNEVSFDAC